MPPYFLAFLSELTSRGHEPSQWIFQDGETATLRLAARHPSVGPIVLCDDREELTLDVGTKYHCHFDGTETEEYGTDRMHAASMLAADFVDCVLREQIGVAVYYNDRRCIGASLIYLDDQGLTAESLAGSGAGVYGGSIRTERFLWSGPVPNPA